MLPGHRVSVMLVLIAMLAVVPGLPGQPLVAGATKDSAPPVDLAQPRLATAQVVRKGAHMVAARPRATVTTATGREAVVNRLIVGLRQDARVAVAGDIHRAAAVRGAGAARVVGPLGRAAHIVDVTGAATLEAAAAAYRADPRVRYAEPDYIVRAFAAPNDAALGAQWGLARIGAPSAWGVSRGSPARRIAVLDCGIYEDGASLANGYPGHPDINGKVDARRDFTGSVTGADDYCDHGTHVAGIAAARTNNALGVAGVGYDTRLLNGKVLDDFGSGSSSEVAQGIYWATDSGAHVINMSLGGLGRCSVTFQDAITYAWTANVVVVAAAGNDNLDVPHQPASCDHVLAVASTDGGDAKSDFSSHGSWVDVAAPGGRDASGAAILSTDYFGDYVYKAGTSMAAPHVAGLAALLWGTGAFVTAQQVVDRITSSADRVPGSGTAWRHGRVNAAAALAGLGGAPPTGTPSLAATLGATTWYFPEGYTGPGFDQYLALYNPNATAAAVAIEYLLEAGPPVTRTLLVPPVSRRTVAVHDPTEGVGPGQAVSTRLTSTNGVGLVVERPMYFARGGVDGGHTVLGATAPATTWYFAEGYTGTGFDTYLAIMNPQSVAAPVTITFFLGDGVTRERQVVIGPRSRATVAVHDPTSGVGRGQAVATRVTTTLSAGIVVERPMYFTYGTDITGGHTVLGATSPRSAWYFAEGYTGAGFDQFVTILNPHSDPAAVTLTYYLSDGTVDDRRLTVAASSRATVAVHEQAQGVGRDHAVALRVATTHPGGIIAERAVYFRYQGQDGGHGALGAHETERGWSFAEGYTAPGYDVYLAVLNPNASPAAVTLTFVDSIGTTRTASQLVGPNRRVTVAVHDPAIIGRGHAVAARVTTDHPGGIVVERASYFRYRPGIDGGHVTLGWPDPPAQ